MKGNQGLVRGHHVLAVGDGVEDERAGRLVAAEELHDDVDVGVSHHLGRVGAQPGIAQSELPGPVQVRRGRVPDLDPAPRPAGDLVGVAPEHHDRSAADRAEAEQPHAHGLHGATPGALRVAAAGDPRRTSSGDVRPFPRSAWRVRCSFSFKAKRT